MFKKKNHSEKIRFKNCECVNGSHLIQPLTWEAEVQ